MTLIILWKSLLNPEPPCVGGKRSVNGKKRLEKAISTVRSIKSARVFYKYLYII